MKRFAVTAALFVLAATGCENKPSRLDSLGKPSVVAASGKTSSSAGEAGPAVEADHSGNVEERLARLESIYAKNAEALDFLGKVYAQQKAQQQAQQREEAAPDAVFAVNIAMDLAAGQVEGPVGAAVTIVEAWDFA